MAFPNYFLGEVLQAITIPACPVTVTLNNIFGVKTAALKQTSSLSQAAINIDKFIEAFMTEHPAPAMPAFLLLSGFGHILTLIQVTPTQWLLTSAAFFWLA